MLDYRFLVSSSNASITIDVIEHCKNMYADDPTSLFDSTQKTYIISHPDSKQRHSSIFTSKLNKLITNTLSLVVDHKVWKIR